MADVILLAVAAAFYPALLAGVILILTRPNPKRQLAGFLAGGMAASVTAGVLILYTLDDWAAVAPRSRRAVSAGVYIVVGVLSLASATRLWQRRDARARRRRSRQGKPSRLARLLGRGSLPLAVIVGVALNLPGAWYLLALKDIGEGGYSTVVELVLVLMFNGVMFILVEVTLAWYVVSPEGAQSAVGRFDAWLRANSRRLGAALAAAIGAYLLVRGIVQARGGG